MSLSNRNIEYLTSLVHELRKLPKETEWLEFKLNNAEPEKIGEYISALSNSAAFCGKIHGYLIWGVENKTHEIHGTSFDPQHSKKGNEELENWLLRSLSPKINFQFFRFDVDGKAVVLLEIGQAYKHPVQFKDQEFIRIGSYQKKLKEFPEKERELWRIFDQTPFESQIAVSNIAADEVLRLLDYPAYFDLLSLPLPEGHANILQSLEADDLIHRAETGNWDITNLGAILFAKKLNEFRTIRRKAIRLVVYKGIGREKTLREQEGNKGYAPGFEGLIESVNNLLPVNEVIGKALRKSVPMYPEIAIRELVANALIHQDFSITGAGPMLEIFDDRMEITNPGTPLVNVDRFLDSPPRSRNEALASLMRRIGVCEERGSGVDKVVREVEKFQLPAPAFEKVEGSTRAVLFTYRPLKDMDKNDRVRSCYLHACLQYVNRKFMTNSSIRERFDIDVKNRTIASRLIRQAQTAGVIVPYDPNSAPKHMKYVPFWVSNEKTKE
jgi:predicted HTH transcriptional regulator